MSNAKLINPIELISAGINPKNGLPLRYGDGVPLKDNLRKLLRITDEQDAINSFAWEGLPSGIDGQLLERILFYKGQAALIKLNGRFFFLPYALTSTSGTGIDVYGRFTTITPLPFRGTETDDQKSWIPGLVYRPVYDVPDGNPSEEGTEVPEGSEDACVILKDYSPQFDETIISRQILNDPLLDVMSECIPFMRTALINSTGVRGMRVSTQNAYSSVMAANDAIKRSALSGEPIVPIVDEIEFQDLETGNVEKAQEFLLAMQGLDNFRLSTHGLDNGGIFQKQAHVLQSEQDINRRVASLVLTDRLERRENFCKIVNAIWGLDVRVKPRNDTQGGGMPDEDPNARSMSQSGSEGGAIDV